MLKGISPLLSPDLLKVLAEMGHGDEIVLADAHFPAYNLGVPVLRADGINVAAMLAAILPVFELDRYVEHPLLMMAAMGGDILDEDLMASCRAVLAQYAPKAPPIHHIDKFEFYDRTRRAFAVVVTGETVKYGNILLKKGVIG